MVRRRGVARRRGVVRRSRGGYGPVVLSSTVSGSEKRDIGKGERMKDIVFTWWSTIVPCNQVDL